MKKLVLRYEQPSQIRAVLDRIEVRIVFYGPNLSSKKFNEYILSYETRTEIASLGEEVTLEDFLTVIRRLQNFLSLSMGVSTYPIRIVGVSDAHRIEPQVGRSSRVPIEIKYLVPRWPIEFITYHAAQFLFTLTDIEEFFETCIRNWEDKYEILEPVITLYFSVIYNPHSYSEIKFLTLAQAVVETYHRRVFGGKYQSNDIYLNGLYQKFVEAIPSDLDTGFNSSLLTGKLRFANEFSLRRRLQELLRGLESELDFDFVNSKRERENFISKIVDTRNFLTHYSPELENKAERKGEGLFILSTRLQLILEVYLLKEIGFSLDLVRRWIIKSQRFKFLMSRS